LHARVRARGKAGAWWWLWMGGARLSLGGWVGDHVGVASRPARGLVHATSRSLESSQYDHAVSGCKSKDVTRQEGAYVICACHPACLLLCGRYSLALCEAGSTLRVGRHHLHGGGAPRRGRPQLGHRARRSCTYQSSRVRSPLKMPSAARMRCGPIAYLGTHPGEPRTLRGSLHTEDWPPSSAWRRRPHQQPSPAAPSSKMELHT
jgi:hypothetical protein